jgi:hypothetical protein
MPALYVWFSSVNLGGAWWVPQLRKCHSVVTETGNTTGKVTILEAVRSHAALHTDALSVIKIKSLILKKTDWRSRSPSRYVTDRQKASETMAVQFQGHTIYVPVSERYVSRSWYCQHNYRAAHELQWKRKEKLNLVSASQGKWVYCRQIVQPTVTLQEKRKPMYV